MSASARRLERGTLGVVATLKKRPSARDELARRAREEEAKLRARGASLPPEELRDGRREREAHLVFQAKLAEQLGDEEAAEAVEKAAAGLVRERQAEAERERLRQGRKRPHKHVPSGLVAWPYVDDGGARRLVADGEPHTGKLLSVRRGASERDAWEPVTAELRYAAQALIGACALDGSPPPPRGGDWAPMDEATRLNAQAVQARACGRSLHVALGEDGARVCPEVAQAIRAAAEIMSGAWISILLEMSESAVLVEHERRRGTHRAEGPAAFEPRAVMTLLIVDAMALRITLPPYVNEELVAWVFDHLAIGVGRGGGKSSKLSPARMRALLADPRKLAAAMKAKRPRRRGPNS